MGKNKNSNVIMICLISVCLFLFCASNVSAAPKISFPEMFFDFGNIPQKQKVSHVFTVKNEGDQILAIGNVNTSCGCTAAIVSNKDISAGESGQIKIEFDSGRRIGKQEKIIYVNSNDTNNPIIQLKIEALVEAGNAKLSVIATTFPLQEFAKAVGKDFVSVDLLSSSNIDPKKLSNADLLLCIGSDTEPWVRDIVNNSNNPYLVLIEFSRIGITIPSKNGECIWLDFEVDQKIIDKIADVFCSLQYMQKDSGYFRSNGELYKQELRNLGEQYKQLNLNPSANFTEEQIKPGVTFLSILQADLENIKNGKRYKKE